MTRRSYIAGTLLRLVVVAVLVLQGMIAGALATRMATAQAVAGPGDTVVICTPEGFKAVPWSDVTDNQIPRAFGCACPCSASCGSCGAGAPMFLAAAVDYGEPCRKLALRDIASVALAAFCADAPGGARAPPPRAV
ncbi:MAG: hypothetical protein AAGF14_05795 [Pseudomonadota bacterium]